MLAIDTNILVRLVLADTPDQVASARGLVGANEVFVASTVLLEAEWVLRSGSGLDRATVLGSLKAFAGLPNVRLQEPGRIAAALNWAANGMDFADALHLAAAEGCEAFISFDRRLAADAARLGALTVREP